MNKDAWFAGFVDGEGCFSISEHRGRTYTVTLKIGQRADSAAILYKIKEVFGGSVCPKATRNRQDRNDKPGMEWTGASRDTVLRLIDYFGRFPLQVKNVQYELWEEAAKFYFRHSGGSGQKHPRWLIEAMKQYKKELERLKEYGEEPEDFIVETDNPQLSIAEQAVNDIEVSD